VFNLGTRTVLILFAAAIAFAQQPSELRLEVLEGGGAINNVRNRTAREPVVQVKDDTGAPVAGAVVTFVLPAFGAGGSFANGEKVLSIRTEEDGRAVASGLKPNGVVGQFAIRVNATHEGRSASTTIVQTNAAPASGSPARSKKLIILGLLAGGIVGGVAAAAGGGGGSSPTTTTPVPPAADAPSPGSITPGTPGIGPPR
jgi:hypothetical protein